MLPLLIAELIVLLHFAFILFVVGGALLVLRWYKLRWLHLPAVVWGVLIEFSGGICPLTPLENRLRGMAGENLYQGGFIQEYLLPIIYPTELTHGLRIALGSGVLLLNLLFYGIVFLRRKKEAR
jgi:hypothetical protein